MSISYRDDFDLYWPDWDEKPQANHDYIIKNLETMNFAISQCKGFSLCVQAGGHVGIWPNVLSTSFDTVWTFEPESDLYQALVLNTSARTNIQRVASALSWNTGEASLIRSTSSGSNKLTTEIVEDYAKVSTVALDSLPLPACDLILLDIEGHEFWALRGAKDTIAKFKPVVQVEELRNDSVGSLEIDSLMTSYGYARYPEKQGKDVVYLPC